MSRKPPVLAVVVWTILAVTADGLSTPLGLDPHTTRGATTPPGVSYTPPHPFSDFSVTTTRFTPSTAPPLTRSQASGKYLITVPQVAIPGFNFTIGFESFTNQQPYQLKARLYEQAYLRDDGYSYYTYHEIEIVNAYGNFQAGSPGVIELPVPEIMRSTTGNFYWEVSCLSTSKECPFLDYHGNFTTTSGRVSFVDDVTTIFVQTDKAIYKPGQLVHYRVFAVYPDLKLYNGHFTIEIRDPNNNKIQFNKDVMGNNGVVEGSLGLADQPLYGDWKITAQIQTSVKVNTYSKSFQVEQYQLPRFEVTVDLPSYILTTDQTLHGTVEARYTFGQPVKGMVELHIMSASARADYCGNEPRHIEQSFDINGEAKFTVSAVDISRFVGRYDGSQLKVTASVKEDLTDVTLKGSSVTTFRTSPYMVRILDNTPSAFKPGLPFSVFAKASMADGTPIVGETNNVISMYVTAHYVIQSDNDFLFGMSQFSGTYPLPVQETTIPPSGVVKMDLDIPGNATSLDVVVMFKGLRDSKYINQVFSLSDNYLQLSMLDKDLKSSGVARIEARATEPMKYLRYQILSRGLVYESKVVDTQGQHVVTFDVTLTPKMAPTAHMLAYYVRPDQEIVPDSMAFNVEGIFENEVSVEMSTNMSEPHADLTVTVRADPHSLVNLLTVDQSVLLLKSGNDVTPGQVSTAIGRYDRGEKPSDSTFALSLSSRTAQETLTRAGVNIVSDAQLRMTSKPALAHSHDPSIYGPLILHNPSNPSHYSTALPQWYPGATPTAYPPMWANNMVPGQTYAPGMVAGGMMGMTTTTMGPSGNTGEQALKEVERVRNLFPETWLWMNTTVGANGSAMIQTTVPDTITSWITTAFAANNLTGLGITATSTKLTVFRPFFVSLTMPTSVVRGEHVVIQASVFNYLSANVSVVVSIPGSRDYTSLVISSDGSEAMSNEDITRTVFVASQGQTAVFFPIIPSAVGAVNIEVSARSTLAADAVRRQLIVEAEGVPTEFSVPVFINLAPNTSTSFSQTFPISMPSDVIDGSARSRVKVTGDLLGPSVAGLENLLRMPTGCGEQNMIKLAPDVYIANYLNDSGQMTSSMEDRVRYLIQTGYQRELTYQRNDWSFSAFGDRDGTGSTWLTAFVLRVFHEARPYVFVDSDVLQRAIDWITKHQNQDGSFNEFGEIWDHEMRHFKDHSNGLTAFVLLSLLENTDVPVTQVQKLSLQNAIGNATEFLKANYSAIPEDDYLSLAMTCLALTKAGSSSRLEADLVFNKLMSKVSNEHGMTFWKTPITSTNRIDPYSRWRPTNVRARPIDIHVTSYALLTYTARGMFEEGMNVLHWLARQRNPYGGFSSTQDTVVGLQAMSEFVHKAVPTGYDLQLDVRAQHMDAHFDVTSGNALALQSKDYSYVPSEVTFSASGKGVAVAELDVFFNVEADLGEPAFEVSTVLLDDYLNSFKVMICTRWLLPGESGMVIQEVGIPSGFAPDMTSVGNVAGIKRTEQRGRYLDIYFDKITKNSLCYTVMFDRQSKVAHSQPSYVITQDYYEPSNRATASYQSLSLKNAGVCDVCPDCCNTTS